MKILRKLSSNLVRKPLLASSLVALSIGMAAGSASAQTIIKVGHVVAPENSGNIAIEHLAKELKERTDGRIEMQIFPSAQLGSERELVESIQLGNVDMTFVSSAVLGAFNPEFFALDIPFLFQDRDAVYRVLDGEIGTELLASLNNVGIKGLGYWENGFRQLSNNKKEIKSPEDLKGMKIRTMENEVHLAAWKELGANPAPLAFGELFTALQQGTFDAQENPISLFYDTKFYEAQKNMTITNHVYSPWPVLINPDIYASLGDDQKIFDEVFKETIDLQRNLAKQADEKAIEAMTDVTFTYLTPEEHKAFADQMAPIHEMVKKKIGPEVVDAIIAEVNQ